MTIRKGEAWGVIGTAPADVRRVHSDAELRALVVAARGAGAPIPTVALLGGDLMRAVGGSGDASRLTGEVPLLPIDVVRVEANGRTSWFVVHLVARRSWWRGEVVAAVNAQYVGRWDVAPRAHPNDGRVDVVRASPALGLRDRWRAKQRLPQGAHVPHPEITTRQTASTTIDVARPVTLLLDGEPWERASSCTLTVEPDALTVCV